MKNRKLKRRNRVRRDIDALWREFLPDAADRKAHAAYRRLVLRVQQVSALLRRSNGVRFGARGVAARVLQGLGNLADSHRAWIREPESWTPQEGSARRQFNSLVRHLIDEHPVPEFMINCWMGDDHPAARMHRVWYVHYARAGTIRGTCTPSVFSRIQAKCFAEAPDHFTVSAAVDWAKAGCRRQANTDPRPILVNRRRWKQQQAAAQRWHRGEWKPISVPNFRIADPDQAARRIWTITQLLTRADLIREGRTLNHCVATYHRACTEGETSIWSMRVHEGGQRWRRVTIELNPESRRIVTALGYSNRRVMRSERRIMECWAAAHRLAVASWI